MMEYKQNCFYDKYREYRSKVEDLFKASSIKRVIKKKLNLLVLDTKVDYYIKAESPKDKASKSSAKK